MIRITEHTRRKPGRNCHRCELPIEPGERYRARLAFASDYMNDGYVTVHSDCVSHDEWWELTDVWKARRNAAAAKEADLLARWNRCCPVGTPIRFWPGVREGEGRPSKTRTTAWMTSSGHASVMVEDYTGGIALTHVAAL